MLKKRPSEVEYRAAMEQVRQLYIALSGVPNIVGPAYGAAMCDRAMKVERLLHPLALGLEDAANYQGIELDRVTDNCMPHQPPGVARSQLGEMPGDAYYGRCWPMLTATEHHTLGLRLREAKTTTAGLVCKLANAFPKSDQRNVAGRARRVERALAALCHALDNQAHKDWPALAETPPGLGIGPVRSWY